MKTLVTAPAFPAAIIIRLAAHASRAHVHSGCSAILGVSPHPSGRQDMRVAPDP
jgi:hypothetical protein